MAAISPTAGDISGVAADDVLELYRGNRQEFKRVTVEEFLRGTGIAVCAPVWNDLLGAAISLQQSGQGVSRNLAENQVEFLQSSNLDDYLVDSQQLGHGWNGEAVFPHVHFYQTAAAMPNFLIQYRWQKMNALKVTSWTNVPCITPVFVYPGSGAFHQLATTGDGIAPPEGAGISDCIQFRVLRDNANASAAFAGADPVAATVAVISFDTHIALDSLGSRTISAK
jgi:hypothetical protein